MPVVGLVPHNSTKEDYSAALEKYKYRAALLGKVRGCGVTFGLQTAPQHPGLLCYPDLPDHTRDPAGGCQPPSIHCARNDCSCSQGAAVDVGDQWQEASNQLQVHKDTQQATASIISD